MMNKKSVIYLLIGLAGVIILIQLGISRSPFGRNETDFAVKTGTEITGIDLIRGEKKVILRKEGDDWVLNRTMEARKSAVQFLIRTLSEMKIKSPVSSEKFNDEIAVRKIEPVRVNVYERRRIVRSFYVYITGSNIYGNIMKLRPSSGPFIVYLPGYEDNIGAHFSADILFWQPFSVFRLLPSEIESIEFQNFNEPEESFTIIKSNNTFSLKNGDGQIADADSALIKRYVSYFVSVALESWAFDLDEERRNEIESSPPLYIITVTKPDGGVIRLKVWEKWNTGDKGKIKDTDRVWAETEEGKGLFVMRYFDLDPVIKKKSYFFGG